MGKSIDKLIEALEIKANNCTHRKEMYSSTTGKTYDCMNEIGECNYQLIDKSIPHGIICGVEVQIKYYEIMKEDYKIKGEK